MSFSSRGRAIASLLNENNEIKETLQPDQVETSVYASVDDLPVSGNDAGDQAFVSSTNNLYIWSGSGWYRIALINVSPTFTVSPAGTYELNTDGTATTITINAVDSDGIPVTFSAITDSDFDTFAVITKDSDNGRVFTVTPDSENEAPATTNTGSVTFRASDGVNQTDAVSSFTLTFANIIDNSAETLLLMKAAGNSATNAAITFLDSDNSSQGFTETGSPKASTFSPYRSGGYSTYFGSGTDRIYTGSSADFDLDTNDWCYEGFFYVPSEVTFASYARLMGLGVYYNNPSSFGVLPRDADQSNYITVYWGDGGSNASRKLISSTTFDKGQWNHIAVVRKGGAIALYYNGTRIANNASYGASTDIGNGNTYAFVGHTGNGTEGTNMYFRDVRLVNGSSIYDPADSEITVPTEALTAVTNTKLLVGATPYIADISSSAHALTLSGVDGTYPFSPYDYEPWAADRHGGSLHIDGAGSYVSVDAANGRDSNFDLNGNSWTLRTWIYPDGGSSETRTIFSTGGGNASWSSTNGAQYQLFINTSNQLSFAYNNSGSASTNATTETIPLNAWSYVSVSHTDGGDTQMHINGEKVKTISSPTYTDVSSQNLVRIGTTQSSSYETSQNFHGNIADFEFINGTAVYSDSDYTVPTAPITRHSDSKLLMQNKSDANIYDAAAGKGFALVGSTTTSTSQRKFSTSSSIYFDGTNDAIEFDNFALDGDLTIEGWFYQAVATDSNYRMLMSAETYGSSAPIAIYTRNAEVQGWANSSSASFVASSFSANTWHHVAVVRNSGTWKIYLDGTGGGTTTTNGSYSFANTTDWRFGAWTNLAYDWNGYMQDWRISNTARYTTNFTPPTAEFEL